MIRAWLICTVLNSALMMRSLGTSPRWIDRTTGSSDGVAMPRWYSMSLLLDPVRSPR